MTSTLKKDGKNKYTDSIQIESETSELLFMTVGESNKSRMMGELNLYLYVINCVNCV